MIADPITTILVPAAAAAPAGAYDLTDLASAKDELSILPGETQYDAFLSRAITQASSVIASHCNRVFAVEAVQDTFYLRHRRAMVAEESPRIEPLQLSRWPLALDGVVSFTGTTHGNASIDGIADTSILTSGALIFAADGSLPAGAKITGIAAGAVTISKPSAVSETVGFTTGLQVSAVIGGAAQSLTYGVDFTVDAKSGQLLRLAGVTGVVSRWRAEQVIVQYQAGFTAIPSDLAQAVLRLVTARFQSRGRDPMLRSEGEPQLGTRQYWVGQMPGQAGALPPEIQGLVDRYLAPSVA